MRHRFYLAALLGVALVLAGMAVGPFQSYMTAADRTDALAASVERLRAEVDELEEERERLENLEDIELLARSEQGMMKPGEIPYVVVTPEPEFERPEPESGDDPERLSWHERLREAAAGLFR